MITEQKIKDLLFALFMTQGQVEALQAEIKALKEKYELKPNNKSK